MKKTYSVLITRSLNLPYAISMVVALLLAASSLAGLFFQSTLYPTEELRQAFVSNDVVNLFIGLPILLGSLSLARKDKLIGLLFWPGALFYISYNAIAYAVAMPMTAQFVAYLAQIILSGFSIFYLFTSLNLPAIQQQLAGAVPEKFAGGVLAGLGSLFFLRAIGQVISAFGGQVPLTRPELAVMVADLLTIPAWVAGGILLWRRQSFGYASGTGLLFQASMLFIGLLVFFILQPFFAAVPFPMVDFVVVLAMGLICFVPFGLFMRGVLKKR